MSHRFGGLADWHSFRSPPVVPIRRRPPWTSASFHLSNSSAFRENDFKFPGELGGMPLPFHDIGHVLAGYGTDPQSELQQAAFQAGFARRDGFTFLLFGIMQFHLGLKVTPVADGHHGLFDVPRVIEALGRGAACKVDFTQGYDLFADQDRPVEEVRRHLGITPLAHGSVHH